MSLFVLFHFSNEKYMKDDEGEGLSRRKPSTWAGLLATSLIVMVNCSRLYENASCKDIESNGADLCRRVKYGVSVGAISGIVALVWLILCKCFKGRCGDIINAILVWALLVFWVIGVIYLTFPDDDAQAPATQPSNIYFFTWGSFALCTAMAVTGLMNLFKSGDGDTEEAPKEQDKEVEKDEVAAAEEGGGGEEGQGEKEVKAGEEEAEA